LKGGRLLSALIKATANGQTMLDKSNGLTELSCVGESCCQMESLFAYSLGSFMETAIWISPTTHQENPMLDEQRQQFSIELAQDAPGLATAGFVELALSWPSLFHNLKSNSICQRTPATVMASCTVNRAAGTLVM
jgi:hypothetical protein